MDTIKIKFIAKNNILIILPLLKKLNDYTSEEVLKNRVLEMSNQNYKCIGVFDNEKLIGIAGLWFLTRHYAGKVIEPDHVIIDESYRNLGLGSKLFDFIHDYAKKNDFEALELNTYIDNLKSHHFYEQMNYKKLGFHYLKKF
jgi:GNAT superfamily N-acetyltransferase